MSHCRFHNTLMDLHDCEESMGEEISSIEEATARIRLIRLCIDIAENYDPDDFAN
jgi:hypothetical protein